MKAQLQMIMIVSAGQSERAGNDGSVERVVESVSAAVRLPKMCDPLCGECGING